MTYLLFAFVAFFLWAITDIIDKILMDTPEMDAVSYTIFSLLLSAIIFLILLVRPLSYSSVPLLWVMLGTGVLFVLFMMIYFHALKLEEVSRVAPLLHLYPIFVLILSFVFLASRLTSQQYLACILLICGGILISIKKGVRWYRISPAFFVMLLAAFIIAVHDVLLKYIYKTEMLLDGYLWVKLGGVGSAVMLLFGKKTRQRFTRMFQKLSLPRKGACFFSVILGQVAMLCFFKAVQLGSVEIVSAMTGFTSLFVFGLSLFFSIKFSHLIKEATQPKIILLKGVALALFFMGLFLLYMDPSEVLSGQSERKLPTTSNQSKTAAAEKINYEKLRSEMVDTQLKTRGISDSKTLGAMGAVLRHEFVPDDVKPLAYEDGPLSIGHGQTISQPYIVALMTQSLGLRGQERVLEIGTGSGYQAAVLATIVKEVYTIEIVPPLATRAQATLKRLKYKNVFVKTGDGYQGWPEKAPFDAIMVTAAAPKIPQPLLDQLKLGGKMVIPVESPMGFRGSSQHLELIVKTQTGFDTKIIEYVLFVPMTGKVQE